MVECGTPTQKSRVRILRETGHAGEREVFDVLHVFIFRDFLQNDEWKLQGLYVASARGKP